MPSCGTPRGICAYCVLAFMSFALGLELGKKVLTCWPSVGVVMDCEVVLVVAEEGTVGLAQ